MEFSGKTVEEATDIGLKELGVEREKVTITVINEEVKGLFGKLKKEAVVNIEKIATSGERATEFINGVFEKIGKDGKATLIKESDNIIINVETTNSASIIGYRGEVLDALQNLAGAVANKGNEVYIRVVVDCEEYRAKREDTLVNLGKKLAEKAVRQGRDILLEPMNPYERRVIHSTLADSQEVTTHSDGKEPNRYVVITPNVKKEFKKREFGDRPYRNDRPYNNNATRPYNNNGDRPYNNNGGTRTYNNNGDRPYNNNGGTRIYNNNGDKPYRNDRPYNNDRRPGADGASGGYNRDRRPGAGYTNQATAPRKTPTTFGTYLGNSNEDKPKDEE